MAKVFPELTIAVFNFKKWESRAKKLQRLKLFKLYFWRQATIQQQPACFLCKE